MIFVGTATGPDPTGPDAYGYYAYDNTDTSYEMHPTYDYVDISSVALGGTNLNFDDPGDKGSRLRSMRRPDQSVSGSSSTVRSTIQSPFARTGGALSAIRPTCSCSVMTASRVGKAGRDDRAVLRRLASSGASRGVWIKQDTTNHRFIIQWKAGGGSVTARR